MSESDYLAALATGATTRARCWRLARRDGVVLGFTDHDRALAFLGTTFEPRAGASGSEAASSLGLSVDDTEAAGALSSDALTERDLARGAYDGAAVLVFDVDWSNPAARRLVGAYTIGEIERDETGFRAEMRSRVGDLDKSAGRWFLSVCDATLGDARCGVDLAAPAFTGAGVVDTTGDGGLTLGVSGLGAFAAGFFSRGIVRWTTGANAGQPAEVRAHGVAGGGQSLSLWRRPASLPAPGDQFQVSAGCDRTWTTCRARFGNGVNFRGFPLMPGDSVVTEYAVRGAPGQDGAGRFGNE